MDIGDNDRYGFAFLLNFVMHNIYLLDKCLNVLEGYTDCTAFVI